MRIDALSIVSCPTSLLRCKNELSFSSGREECGGVHKGAWGHQQSLSDGRGSAEPVNFFSLRSISCPLSNNFSFSLKFFGPTVTTFRPFWWPPVFFGDASPFRYSSIIYNLFEYPSNNFEWYPGYLVHTASFAKSFWTYSQKVQLAGLEVQSAKGCRLHSRLPSSHTRKEL